MNSTNTQIHAIASIARAHELSLVLQFGSTVGNRERHPGSDVDVAVRFSGKVPSFDKQLRLLQELQDVYPGEDVDLAVINHADPLYLNRITGNCRLLYGATRELQELKIYAFKRYQDHLPYFAMEQEFVHRYLDATAEPR